MTQPSADSRPVRSASPVRPLPAASPSSAASSAASSAVRPVALVTGARRGIGRGIALALARQGFDLALSDLVDDDEDAHRTLAAVRELGARASLRRLDVAQLDSHETFLARLLQEFGSLECLVNNAGISVAQRGDLLQLSPDSFDRLLHVNLRGPFFLTQRVALEFLAHADDGRYRCIVNISSANAFAASTNRGEYCISKSAISMATQLYAARLGAAGISAFELRPGIIRTDMTRVAAADYDERIGRGLTPMPRWGEPEDVGRAVAALASGAFAFSTGDAIHVDGGLHVQRL
ncbi:MAG: 3-ketoacyl-ACP reductase [Burkholderiaceae bacterium]